MTSIIHNLGLGDHIIMAPIVAKIASETKGKISVPCWKHNRESAASFYVNIPNVHAVAIEKESELRDFEPAIKFGCYSDITRNEGEDFISWFYRQANFPLEDREKWCPLREAAKKVEMAGPESITSSPFIFKHDDPSRGFNINQSMLGVVVKPYHDGGTILNTIWAIARATEIHCIDSSFLHLADALPTTGKLFWHRYARSGEHNLNLKLRKQWTVLD